MDSLEGSRGFVQYRIKPKTNLAAGVQIKNSAYIFFDSSPPINTNNTVTIGGAGFSVYGIQAGYGVTTVGTLGNPNTINISSSNANAVILYGIAGYSTITNLKIGYIYKHKHYRFYLVLVYLKFYQTE